MTEICQTFFSPKLWNIGLTNQLIDTVSVLYRIPGSAPVFYPRNVGGGGGTVGILIITWDVSSLP